MVKGKNRSTACQDRYHARRASFQMEALSGDVAKGSRTNIAATATFLRVRVDNGAGRTLGRPVCHGRKPYTSSECTQATRAAARHICNGYGLGYI